MEKRYCIFAKFRDGRFYLLNFNKHEILECLEKVPPAQGLLAIANWPIDQETEIEFFLELINGNVVYYHIMDRIANTKNTVVFDKKELDQ